jgi:hypothetical protein
MTEPVTEPVTEPSSFCCISTNNCKDELIGMLLSLSLHHPNAKVVCMVDDETNQALQNCTPKIQLDLHIIINLNEYSGKNRAKMEAEGIFGEFLMAKANVVEEGIKLYGDSMMLDTDMIILNKLYVDKTKEIGVSPHYIVKKDTDIYGYYNSGLIWSRVAEMCVDWREFNKTSRYFEQASVEDLAKKYTHFEFNKSYNFSWWRVGQADETPQQVVDHLSVKNGKIYFDNWPLKIVHTHFNSPRFEQFNNLIKSLLVRANAYKELAIIDRSVDGKWTIMVPKQPMPFPWHHANDSFREMVLLMNTVCKDVKGVYSPSVKNVFLKSGICLYDRDNTDHYWLDEETYARMMQMGSPIMYLGNCDMKEDEKIIRSKYNSPALKIYPWTYWSRFPIRLAKKLNNGLGTKTYAERSVRSIFIGNVENSVQGKYRVGKGWETAIDVYHCTMGREHKFTHEEYLDQLANAKFGLSLRGFGAKCHREIELMACGTVPVVSSDVCTDSYINPLMEGVHYLRVNAPEELNEKIGEIDEEKWTQMSNACKKWYYENTSANGLWKNLITHILYKS